MFSVWIGCIACYNDGNLVGEWVEADLAGDIDPADIHNGPTDHEELWVYDTDGAPFEGECSPSNAQGWADAVSRVSYYDGAALREIASEYDSDPDAAVDILSSARGPYGSFREYADELAEGMLAEHDQDSILVPYFDYLQWAHDLELESVIIEGYRGTYIIV